MFFRRLRQKIIGFAILGFVLGIFLAFILPPVVIVVIEGVLLGLLCWCFYCI